MKLQSLYPVNSILGLNELFSVHISSGAVKLLIHVILHKGQYAYDSKYMMCMVVYGFPVHMNSLILCISKWEQIHPSYCSNTFCKPCILSQKKFNSYFNVGIYKNFLIQTM